jgi:hypothetical protein
MHLAKGGDEFEQVRSAFGINQNQAEIAVTQGAGDGQMHDLKLHDIAEDGFEAEHTQRIGGNDADSFRDFGGFTHRTQASSISAWLIRGQ